MHIIEWWEDFLEKIEAIAKLKPNWDSYDGDEPDPNAIRNAIDTVPKIVGTNTPMPSVHPIPDGGISVEWHLPHMNVEIEFTTEDKIVAIIDDIPKGDEFDCEQGIRDNLNKIKSRLSKLGKGKQDD